MRSLFSQKAEAEDLRQDPDALEDHSIVKLQNRQQSERVTKPNQSRQRRTQTLLPRQAARHDLQPQTAATSATQWQWFVYFIRRISITNRKSH